MRAFTLALLFVLASPANANEIDDLRAEVKLLREQIAALTVALEKNQSSMVVQTGGRITVNYSELSRAVAWGNYLLNNARHAGVRDGSGFAQYIEANPLP